MDWKGIYDFCLLVGTTPDKLVRRNHSVFSNRFSTEPLPAEIAEASVQMFLDTLSMGVNKPLLNFMIAECHKADRLGYGHLNGFMPTNTQMMETAERAYDAMEDETPEVLMTSDGELPETVSPVAIIVEEIIDICIEYERQMFIYISNLAKDIDDVGTGREHHEKIIQRCASALAPTMKGNDWLQAVNDSINKNGLEPTLKMLLKNPSAYHATRMFLDSATIILPGGKCLKGHDIVKEFCEAYRAFSKCSRTKTPEKMRALIEKREDALTRLGDFRTWRTAPQTQVYFQALANSRYIEQELSGWVPGPNARQTPRTGYPVLSLPKPEKPAQT